MSSCFPDPETVRTALSMASRAPSVHNTQPWRWRVGEESLHLYAEPALQLRHTDPDSRDLIISCGAALNHCSLALAALGWQSKIHRFPNAAEPYHLASIEVQQWVPGEVDVALAAAIPRRRTDRRRYSSWPVPHGDVALMGARAARAGVAVRRVEAATELKAVLADAVYEHVNDAEYLAELAMWSGRHAATAGVPARNTPVSEPDAQIPGRMFAGPVLAQPPGTTVRDDQGILLALGTAEDDALARLRAGEATSLLLLTATAVGMATCPVTEALEIAATRDAIQTEVFGMDAFPQMLIRVGWAPVNADPLPATPRRALAEIATMLDGSALG
ncbi:nitroreductase family protein [Mycolicibacterium sp.]|uniref:Acg family FMN-binding oxidoreductase n=1 Tax=Mycolicibacterium sp. TaxID=2320850 RepID=UPI001A1FBAFE|nr:nitroreductase family protein [Mycolicibacterium sp.]MBJ7338116.1 nitroreductase family protein [Mycolicibacterium sp.]